MKITKVRVVIPYSVEFIRHRRRTVEGGIFWDDGEVAICTVTAQEAPVAYRIAPGDDSFGPEFDIRSFDGKLWWPLLDTPFLLSVGKYIDSATDSDACFLSMMNLSPASVYSPRRQTTAQFENDMSIRRIQSSSKDERWISAHRAAKHTLFRDDVVYLEGGQPCFFGISCGADSDMVLSLEIGSLQPQAVDILARWLPGPQTNRRHDAACRSHVFHVENIENEVSALKRKGFRLDFNARATICMHVEPELDPSEVCVDALVRRALKQINPETARRLRQAMNDRPIPTTTGLMNRSDCRDALHKVVSMCPPQLARTRFGFEFDWVAEAVQRLDARFPPPSLSAEDGEALLAMCLLPATLQVG